MAIDLNDTLQMMQVIDRAKAPASFLLDTFFPQIPSVAPTAMIGVEYRKGARKLAPFLSGGQGVEMNRDESELRFYKPPVMAPKRTITEYDVSGRAFGEQILGSKSPAERASELQARDFRELQAMIVNRKNKMAAELLTSGEVTVSGFADDGKTAKEDKITFSGWTQEADASADWDSAGADILGDITEMSYAIQESSGMIPTVMICGKNIQEYMLNNDTMYRFLAIANRDNIAIASIQPRLTAPQAGYIGKISALNLEMYSYMETYLDDDGEVKLFLGENEVIIAIPGRGRQLHGAVTLVDGRSKTMNTYAGIYIPKYSADEDNNSLALTMYSRCILAPETVDDWGTIHAKK